MYHVYIGIASRAAESYAVLVTSQAVAERARALLSHVRRQRDAGRLVRELAFARVQFDVLAATGPAHKTRHLAERLWRLQRRIAYLERCSASTPSSDAA